jgi:hypothetical protein
MTRQQRDKRVDQYRSEIAKLARELANGAEGSMHCDLIAKTAARASKLAAAYVEFVDEGMVA